MWIEYIYISENKKGSPGFLLWVDRGRSVPNINRPVVVRSARVTYARRMLVMAPYVRRRMLSASQWVCREPIYIVHASWPCYYSVSATSILRQDHNARSNRIHHHRATGSRCRDSARRVYRRCYRRQRIHGASLSRYRRR